MTRKNTRPAATEDAIREMHDRSGAYAADAALADAEATRIIAEAESAAEAMRRDAVARAEEHREHARKMAADLIAKAEADATKHIAQAKAAAAQRVQQADAEAEEKARRIHTDAEANLQQAYRVAQDERDKKATAEQLRDYWRRLAEFEAEHAGLPVAAPTLTDGELDVRRDLPTAEQDGGQQP